MSDYTVHENQTLLDVAAHAHGHIEAVMSFSIENNLSITGHLSAGKIIKVAEAKTNGLVKKAIEGRNIIPATQLSTLDLELLNPSFGIGSMVIESTFIVR